jgi:flagellar basal body-associated protein FliL
MGLGGVLLSSIAGAMIGSWLGNKLFNNQNFQNQRQTQYKSPQTYSKSQSSFTKTPATTGTNNSTTKKSGFFGGGGSDTKSTSGSSSSFGS